MKLTSTVTLTCYLTTLTKSTYVDVILAAAEKKKKSDVVVNDLPLEENINRLETEGEARSVEEAISVLRLVFVSRYRVEHER